jgi:hypothetical protein
LESGSGQPLLLLFLDRQCIERQTAYAGSVDRNSQFSRALIMDDAGFIEMSSTRQLDLGTAQWRKHVPVDAGRGPAERAIEPIETN